MTRSERLEKAIERIETITLRQKAAEYGVTYYHDPLPIDQYELILSLLLAEQKRAAGCAYCNGNMLDGYALENMYGESQRIINLAMKNHRSGDQLPISFCPNCGRSLTGGESV